MAVSPSRSWSALPECYRKLMGREDSDYPKLETDKNGKRFSWKDISEELLLSATRVVDEELTIHELRRNSTRQEKIFLHRNSKSLPHIEVTVQTPYRSPQKLPTDSATSGIGGWILPGDNNGGFSDGSFRSPIKDLLDITNDQAISATFFNPHEEAVNPIPRLLGNNVRVPDKTVTGADISKRPLWHTFPGLRPPQPIAQRPDTIWKPTTPVTPREEHKNAGTGWMGRGKGNAVAAAAAETQLSSCYGHGAGKGTAAETQRSSSYSYRKDFHGVDMHMPRGQSRGRFDKDDRPHGSALWTGDSSGSGARGW